ncbi:MAG: hypothetical protein J5822_08175 [Eubacteriaceae bacterium]|nr:hypothetical protein [Eubacteriaceae bacterium]
MEEKKHAVLTDEQMDRVVGGNELGLQHAGEPIWDQNEESLFGKTGGDLLSLSSSSYDSDPWAKREKQNYDSWLNETGGDLSKLDPFGGH